jgi:isopenicillin-N epimerase
MLEQWLLDPEITYLNHGTVGATPRLVLEAQQALRDEIEQQPARALAREIAGMMGERRLESSRLRSAAEAVAAFLGAKGQDLVFVDNATAGINAVLRSLDLSQGDEILLTNHAYGGVARAAAFASRVQGAQVRVVELPYPSVPQDEIVETFAGAIRPRTRIALVDHVSSETALILPLAGIAGACREAGVPVLVDGAHAPGMLPLDIEGLGVDWYSGTLHKWAFAPRSCGFLWAAPERQAELHPPVISWGLDEGFLVEFDWPGTRDPTPYLAAPAGISFLQDLGETDVYEHNHDLAWTAARLLAGRWDTRLGSHETMAGSMTTVELPRPLGLGPDDAARVRDELLYRDQIEVAVHARAGRLWARICAQVYNELSDYERLATAVVRLRS